MIDECHLILFIFLPGPDAADETASASVSLYPIEVTQISGHVVTQDQTAAGVRRLFW